MTDPAPASTERDDANTVIAANLRELADLLEQQGSDGFRIAAYRKAAATVEQLGEPAAAILERGGPDALVALPGIGRSIAAAIAEMVRTGRWTQLERLRGTLDTEALFRTVPGIGPELAERIHDELQIDSLEGLETAAWDGRLDELPGFGPRRLEMLRASLAERLGRRRIRPPASAAAAHAPPGVGMLLDVDKEYRDRAARGDLRLIAPKRFNPDGVAWLPVMHTRRGDWQFTVLFSNTRRAHELGRTNDWVVVYFHTDAEPESQCTVVTERTGPLAGHRVIRGREAECRAYYGVEAG